MMKLASLLRVGAKATSAPRNVPASASSSSLNLLVDNNLEFSPSNHLIYNKRSFSTTGKLNILGNSNVEATIPNISLVKEKLQKIMGLEKGYSPLLPSRGHLAQYLPTQQEELPARTMQDSFSSTIIPLSTDITLQEKYSTFLGQVRLGRLMEDMDTFAAWVAHNHIYNPKLPADTPTPYVIVTVLVDQIDFTDVIPKPDADIRLSGHVSWVGRSSIETVVWLEQKIHDKWTKITRALFLMAARNPTNSKAAIVNSLVPGNEEEQKILEGGESRKRRRQNATAKSLLKVIPDQEEQGVIHDLFLKTLDARDPSFRASHLPPGAMWMKAAQMDNLVFSHPEDRNLHQKVFGGFLMRQAFELSWACGWVFSKQRPTLMHISDIMFHKSVDVSSLIKMRAQIVYTELHYMQIVVNAEVFDAKTGAVSTTNVFHYTYKINDVAPQIIPKSYHESMLYLDGKRHFQRVMGLK